MSPIPHKSAFEPKNARVTSLYEEDDDDEEELEFLSLTSASNLTQRPRRKKTGTQELAEFLITTSPEEFQKSPPKRSANPFFRRRNKNNKPSLSSSTPNIPAYRAFGSSSSGNSGNKHIELVPTNTINSSNSNNNSTVSLSRIASITSKSPSVLRRSIISNGDPQSPILPSNRNSKARESSLYSDSLRYSLSTRSQNSVTTNNNNYHFMSVRSQHSLLKRQDTYVSLTAAGPVARRLDEQEKYQEKEEEEEEDLRVREVKATEALVNHYTSLPVEEFDTIERALAQRLERFRHSNMNTPSGTVAAGLAMEHIRALEASSQAQHQQQLIAPAQTVVGAFKEKKKMRHMQVQTMPVLDDKPRQDQQHNSPGQSCSNQAKLDRDTDQARLIEQLQLELAEETLQRKRLQTALDDTCDHFETLSGLAYKRLRELWEEKMHWENACIELREKMLNPNKREDAITEFPESVI